MLQKIPLLLMLLTLLVLPHAAGSADPAEEPTASETSAATAEAAFLQDVLPVLQEHCFECHSHDAGKIEGGLVLDSRSGWATGGDSGPALVPGEPDQSLLISAIRYDGHEMPPSGKLPDELIARLERWVADGAHDPRVSEAAQADKMLDPESGRNHWAFQPVDDPPLPSVAHDEWPLADVDRFVLAALEEQGLHPVGDADRYTWLRRVTFDLTGLPPTPDEIRAFESDRSPQAFAAVVDRLLGSRAFGERWARHWLDLVGYADQIGTSNSVFAQFAWRYRDYVIDSLNSDKPFDRFIREQIAGDLLPCETVEEQAGNLTATGFLVLGDIEIVEADKAKLLVDIVDQQVNKVGKAFLAMTLECARCHAHKFDPVTLQDYYGMAGFFHSTSTVFKTDRGVWSDVNILDLPETETQQTERTAQQAAHAAQLQQWQQQLQEVEERKSALDKQLEDETLAQEQREALTRDRDEASKLIGSLKRDIQHAEFFTPTVPKVHGVHDVASPSDMRITIRGNPRALGDSVPRGYLSVISDSQPAIADGESGRRQLADWIADPQNPLTARVAVNRVWQKLFGEGIVRSVDYFGLPGERPSHPELLDHLAARFLSDGWSVKRLIRSLTLSRTYRLSCAHDAANQLVDPDNRLLWRMNRVRLDAEALRDAMLFVSGQLRPSVGGPAMPLEFPENVGGLDPKDVNPPSFRLSRWRPEQEYQRTIYLPVIRSSGQPGPGELRNVFDFPQPSMFTGRRSITAVPTQALFLMNSPVVKRHAAALAERTQAEQADDRQRLELLWLTLLNRPITDSEQDAAAEFLTATGEQGWTELCHALLASNEFLMRL